jgi:hypothetical protein
MGRNTMQIIRVAEFVDGYQKLLFLLSHQSSIKTMKSSSILAMKERKKVSFASTQTLFFSTDYLTLDERKCLCWYSTEDLKHSRSETMEALKVLKEVDGNIDAIDISTGVCLRGIEKYADAVTKCRNQRRFIDSVLQQQITNRQSASKSPDEHLAILCRYMSQPSREMALFYAARCAEELRIIRQLEDQGKTEELSSSSSSHSSPLIEVSQLKRNDLGESSRCSSKKRSISTCFDQITLHASRKLQCCE